jgi:hypothetical protein
MMSLKNNANVYYKAAIPQENLNEMGLSLSLEQFQCLSYLESARSEGFDTFHL